MAHGNNPNEIKPLTPGDLARNYGMTVRTINNWLKPHIKIIGKRNGLFFTPAQVKKIYQCIGLPLYNSPEDLA